MHIPSSLQLFVISEVKTKQNIAHLHLELRFLIVTQVYN